MSDIHTENGPRVYRVPEENLTLLEARIQKLNRRAAKLDRHGNSVMFEKPNGIINWSSDTPVVPMEAL